MRILILTLVIIGLQAATPATKQAPKSELRHLRAIRAEFIGATGDDVEFQAQYNRAMAERRKQGQAPCKNWTLVADHESPGYRFECR